MATLSTPPHPPRWDNKWPPPLAPICLRPSPLLSTTPPVARLQAQCDALTATGASLAAPRSFPFLALHHDTALTLRRNALVLGLQPSLNAIYDAAHPTPLRSSVCPPDGSVAYHTWSAAVMAGSLSPGVMRAATVYRLPLAPRGTQHGEPPPSHTLKKKKKKGICL